MHDAMSQGTVVMNQCGVRCGPPHEACHPHNPDLRDSHEYLQCGTLKIDKKARKRQYSVNGYFDSIQPTHLKQFVYTRMSVKFELRCVTGCRHQDICTLHSAANSKNEPFAYLVIFHTESDAF